MVHKVEEIKQKEIATQKDIDALKEQLKLLEKEQERQKLDAEVNQKKFWTQHKQLRGTVADMKSTVAQTSIFLKKKVAPAIAGGIGEGLKLYREEKKGEVKS